MTSTIVAKDAAKASKGNHAPIPATKTRSWQQSKRKKPSTVRGGGVALDSNDSNSSDHSIEQLTEPSSTVGENVAAGYKSDASEVKLKPFHGKATSPTSKTPISSQTSVGSRDSAETSVPVQPAPFDGVISNPPHYIRPPEHSSSADRPPQQLESVEGSLSEAESVGEERQLFSAPMQEVDQSKSRSLSVSVYIVPSYIFVSYIPMQ